MSYENIIRAWKDETFRNELGETERSLLPEHPAGLVELTDADLGNAIGGAVYTPGTMTKCPNTRC
jgi:mersacidin/lichenicidin family type 2 lantibiotic